jgi:hypothetical protein
VIDTSAEPTSKGDRTPVLVTVLAEDEAASTPGSAAGAVVRGVLTVNANGCFEIDNHIVVAPHGSHVTRDPVGIYVSEAGTFSAGSTLHSSGAYVEHLVTGPDDTVVTEWNMYFTSSTRGFVVLDRGMTSQDE